MKLYAKALNVEVLVRRLGDLIDIKKTKTINAKYRYGLLSEIALTFFLRKEGGQVYAFLPDKKTVYKKCVSSRLLYIILNPSEANKFELLSPSDKKYQVERSLSKYININKLYKSEIGEYYIAKNPNYIIGRSDINASEVYIIDTIERGTKSIDLQIKQV